MFWLIGFTSHQLRYLNKINVLRHQVFVTLTSHKSSLFLCDLVIHFIDVRFRFQYAVGLGLRGCHSNVSLRRSRSARLITKSVYTGVSEWHICISESSQQTSFQRFTFTTCLKITTNVKGQVDCILHLPEWSFFTIKFEKILNYRRM